MKNDLKISNITVTRNTLKSDPSQMGTPIPFQKQFSGNEENIPQNSSLSEIVLFYTMGILFSVAIYLGIIGFSLLNQEWQNTLWKVAMILVLTVCSGFLLSKLTLIILSRVKRK